MAGKGTGAASPPDPVRHRGHDSHQHHDLDITERVIERVPLRPEPPADSGEDEAPRSVPEQCEDVVPRERALEEAGGDRDEGAGERGDAPDENGPGIPALEP